MPSELSATVRLIDLLDERIDTRRDPEIPQNEREAVREALKERVRDIGWELHREGGLKLMQEVCDVVWERSITHMSILNTWWDRIGGWAA